MPAARRVRPVGRQRGPVCRCPAARAPWLLRSTHRPDSRSPRLVTCRHRRRPPGTRCRGSSPAGMETRSGTGRRVVSRWVVRGRDRGAAACPPCPSYQTREQIERHARARTDEHRGLIRECDSGAAVWTGVDGVSGIDQSIGREGGPLTAGSQHVGVAPRREDAGWHRTQSHQVERDPQPHSRHEPIRSETVQALYLRPVVGANEMRTANRPQCVTRPDRVHPVAMARGDVGRLSRDPGGRQRCDEQERAKCAETAWMLDHALCRTIPPSFRTTPARGPELVQPRWDAASLPGPAAGRRVAVHTSLFLREGGDPRDPLRGEKSQSRRALRALTVVRAEHRS